jgi:hypothetical protein
MRNRLLVMLLAAVVGVTFAVGLFLHSRVGGVLVLVVDVVLIGLARIAWPRLEPKGRPLRIVVIAAIAVIGVVKVIVG